MLYCYGSKGNYGDENGCRKRDVRPEATVIGLPVNGGLKKMGFFSDLRADLSQTAGEKKPEELPESNILLEDDIPDMPSPEELLNDMPEPRREKIIFHKLPEGVENVRRQIPPLREEASDMGVPGKMAQGSKDAKRAAYEESDSRGTSGEERTPEAVSQFPENMTVIGDKTTITGRIICSNAIRVNQGAVIIGDIEAPGAVIAGAVKGDIDVKGAVTLESTAVVVGNVRFQSVRIDTGAVIEGMCSQCYADTKRRDVFGEIQSIFGEKEKDAVSADSGTAQN